MVESAEGIGGRKWSFLREGDDLFLMEGKTKIARIEGEDKEERGERIKTGGHAVLHLLATAPQLWDAGNEVAKEFATTPSVLAAKQLDRLRQSIAKAVNKTDYNDVKQA